MHIGLKKKTIAICVAGYNWECEVKIVRGILRSCDEKDIDVHIFSSLMMKGDYPHQEDVNKNLIRGEDEIYNLIKYEQIDGLFLFRGSLYSESSVQKIAANCDKYNIPFVSIHNQKGDFAHNLVIEDNSGLELVVEHLIRDHGLRRLDFIGGYPDNKETIIRLEAYKRVLQKYNIPIEERRIEYGHFWKESVECAKRLLEIDMPDAFVCANDTMAIMVSDYLKNQGYVLPTDVVVTGFDGIADAFFYNPSITTVRVDFENAGVKAFELLWSLMTGHKDAEDVHVYPELLIQESCGCKAIKKRDYNYIDSKYVERYISDTFHKNLIKTDVYFYDSQSSDELFSHLLSEVKFFEFDAFAFCINSELNDVNQTCFLDNKDKFGVSEKLTSYSLDKKDKLVKFDFTSDKLFPEKIISGKTDHVMSFSPLHYKNNYIGYVVYSPADGELFRDFFMLWLINASNAIGSFYIKEELENISYHDYMTGLYNRRGMSRIFENSLKEIEKASGYVTMVCADVDNLKKINDTFGHDAGDDTIIKVAKVLQNVFGQETPCIRTGGDEFCLLMLTAKEAPVKKLLAQVDSDLDEFNKNSGLPYKMQCSSSYCSVKASDFTNFDTLRKCADVELYKVKDIHHHKSTS